MEGFAGLTVLAPADEVGVVAYTKSCVSDARFGSRKKTWFHWAWGLICSLGVVTYTKSCVSEARFGSRKKTCWF